MSLAGIDTEKDWKWAPNRFGVVSSFVDASNAVRFGPFGWLESIIKAIACGVGIGSVAVFDSDAPPLYAMRIVQCVCVGVSLLIHAILTGQRFFYKEVFSFLFAIFVLVGHIIMLVVLFQNTGQPGTFIFTFSFCFFLGEGCRCFIYILKPPRLDWGTYVLLEEAWKRWLVSGVIIVLMLLAWIMQVVIWTTTYIEI